MVCNGQIAQRDNRRPDMKNALMRRIKTALIRWDLKHI